MVHLSNRQKVVLITSALLILASIEVYAHNFVQVYSLPVVTEENVHRFSDWNYYTGTSTFSGSGCRWLIGWIIRRPAPQYGYVDIFKIEQNGSFLVLSTDFLVLGLEATSNHSSSFSAHIDEIEYEHNYTAIRIDYEFGEIGTYQISFKLSVRVFERTLVSLVPKEDIAIPMDTTVYYGP